MTDPASQLRASLTGLSFGAGASLERGARSSTLTPARDDANRSFTEVLGKQVNAPQDQSPESAATNAAQQLVAVALVQPILKQLRETSMAAAPFLPAQGEKQFQSLADAEIAQRIVRSKNFPLVDRIRDLAMQKHSQRSTTEVKA